MTAAPTATAKGTSISVLGYSLRRQIAVGGQATVWTAKKAASGEIAAVKITPFAITDANAAAIKKAKREETIHRALTHDNILHLLGGEWRNAFHEWPSGQYLVLDLAAGGDLFDKIAPDVGLPTELAHLYFMQLLSAVEYLSASKGVVHRDIKPENCLLDGDGNLKLSDFGLATVYKHKGEERPLSDRCGSPPYAAPELAFARPYRGPPIDVWSCGILLFTLLVGNTPWDEPTSNSPEFQAYLDGSIWQYEPWNRIQGAERELLSSLLTVDPAARPSVADIKRMSWCRRANGWMNERAQVTEGFAIAGTMLQRLAEHGHLEAPEKPYEDALAEQMASVELGPGAASQRLAQYISQKTGENKSTFRASMQAYSRMSQAASQRGNPNTTRFFTVADPAAVVQVLEQILSSLSIASSTVQSSSATDYWLVRIRFQTRDRRKLDLEGQIVLSSSHLDGNASTGAAADDDDEVDGHDVVLMRKKGDPLELRRVWKNILDRLPAGVVYSV